MKICLYLYLSVPMMIPMLIPISRCLCRNFQMVPKICHQSYNVQDFYWNMLTSKKLIFKFIFLSFCLAKFGLQNMFKQKPLLNFILKKFDTKHIVTDNVNLSWFDSAWDKHGSAGDGNRHTRIILGYISIYIYICIYIYLSI